MNKSEYIYFDIHTLMEKDGKVVSRVIENVNYLINKPHTNSDGFWGFLNVTPRYDKKSLTLSVNQMWFDLTKYEFGVSTVYETMDNDLKVVLKKLNNE